MIGRAHKGKNIDGRQQGIEFPVLDLGHFHSQLLLHSTDDRKPTPIDRILHWLLRQDQKKKFRGDDHAVRPYRSSDMPVCLRTKKRKAISSPCTLGWATLTCPCASQVAGHPMSARHARREAQDQFSRFQITKPLTNVAKP